MSIFRDIDDIRAAMGSRLGVSEWRTVQQDHINEFAKATGDHQWIHVDAARAADGPFGRTIAHGFLTLSLLPVLVEEIYSIEGAGIGINYGFNRVRFTAPVLVGSKVRAVVDLTGVEEVKDGAIQLAIMVTVELDGSVRPALVAEWLSRQYL